MVSIESVALEVPDPSAADAFYTGAFGLGGRIRVRGSEAPTSGFRGFTLSLVVAQPSAVDHLVASALDAGATEVKPVEKRLSGYGGVVRAADGTICTLAASSKKDTGSGAAHSPRLRESLPKAQDRIGSPSAARPAPSPTPTGLLGNPSSRRCAFVTPGITARTPRRPRVTAPLQTGRFATPASRDTAHHGNRVGT
ncbi:hypothetical protein EV641_113172 [Rhodococcus sp. SMB37]|nr:hypothetical protein EV641_113172 [Rhodococcus sp. SMB37]